MKYKHLSFDLWNTLINANPEYTKARNRYLADTFNTTEQIAGKTYGHIKRMADKMSEEFGHQYSTEHLYELLAKTFDRNVKNSTVVEMRQEMESLFSQYPPIILEELKEQLKLASDKGITLSVLSNTNFMSGETLRKVLFSNLEKNGIKFSYMLFSNEEGVAKPNQLFFDKMKNLARNLNKEHQEFLEIVHIGDNLICDVEGAKNACVTAQYVESPVATAEFLKKYIFNNVVNNITIK